MKNQTFFDKFYTNLFTYKDFASIYPHHPEIAESDEGNSLDSESIDDSTAENFTEENSTTDFSEAENSTIDQSVAENFAPENSAPEVSAVEISAADNFTEENSAANEDLTENNESNDERERSLNRCCISRQIPSLFCFVPCGHLNICSECKDPYSELPDKNCPMCRTPYTSMIRVFF